MGIIKAKAEIVRNSHVQGIGSGSLGLWAGPSHGRETKKIADVFRIMCKGGSCWNDEYDIRPDTSM